MRRRQVSRTQTTSLARRFANSGPVLPFNPASIPGCQLWLDAADSSSILVDSSSNVSLWIDKSSYENNFSLTSGTTSKINDGGYSVINFPSGATMSSAKQITFTTSSAFFIVSKLTSLSAATISMVVGFTNMYDGDYTFVRYNPSTILNGTAATTTNERDLGNNNYYVNGTFNPSTFGSNYYLNTYSIIGTVSPTTSGTSYLTLSSAFSSRYFIGNIAEFLYYPTGLTTIQRQKVEGYLANKWGLKTSLPSNHPYKSIAPTYEEPIFVPTLISGSQLWLDGADASTVTGTSAVTQWRDKSGNGRNLGVGSGTTSYSSSAINLNSSYMLVNSPVNLTNVTVFIVSKSTGVTNQILFSAKPNTDYVYNSVDGFGFYNDPPTGRIRFYGQGNDPMQSIFFTDTSITKLYTFQSTGTTVSGWLNGTSQSGGTLTTTRTSTAQGFAIGGEWGGSSYQNIIVTASIYEILVYNTGLTTSQRQTIEGYLAHKWNIQSSLPANHPFKSTAPTTIPKSLTIQSLSALFSPSSKALSIPSKSSFTLGTNNHTIEFWFYQTNRTNYDITFAYGDNPPVWTGTSTYIFQAGNPHSTCILGNGAGGWAVELFKGGNSYALNTWHHFAIVRNGTTFTLYINGTSHSTATSSVSIGPSFGSMVIGSLTSTGHVDGFTGYISNFRFVNGTAVYTSNFTPPTSPLTAIPNTQVLIQGLVDRSPNSYAVTNNGNVSLSLLSPFV